MTLPTTNTQYTVTFTQPTLTMVLQRQFLPKLGRFFDYKVMITLPIMPDNTLRMSEYQMGRIIEMFKAELVDMLADGLDFSQVGSKEVVIEPEAVKVVPTGDKDIDRIQSLIIRLPGRLPAMLAKDLAVLYNVTTGRLNEAVKRNEIRFPDDFRYQATDEETKILISQNAISKNTRAALPYLFTQFGANQLSTVLHSKTAVERSIQIMRAFTLLEQGSAQPVTCSIQEKLDEAVKTKAAIGDKKVATALGRVGNLTKENKKLIRENQSLRRRLAVV